MIAHALTGVPYRTEIVAQRCKRNGNAGVGRANARRAERSASR